MEEGELDFSDMAEMSSEHNREQMRIMIDKISNQNLIIGIIAWLVKQSENPLEAVDHLISDVKDNTRKTLLTTLPSVEDICFMIKSNEPDKEDDDIKAIAIRSYGKLNGDLQDTLNEYFFLLGTAIRKTVSR